MFVRSLVAGDNQADRVLLRSPAGQTVRTHILAAEVVDRNLVVGDSRVGHWEPHIGPAGEPHIDQAGGHHIDQEEGHHIARVEERRTGLLGVAVHRLHPWCQKTGQ